MHCPNCAQPATADQQFCRSCGMSLEAVSKLVAEHSSSPVEVQKKADKVALEAAIVRTMFNWIMWGMIAIGVGVLLLVINKNIGIGSHLNLPISFLLLGGVGIVSAGVLKAIKQGTLLATSRNANQITGSPDTKSLPTHPIPASLPSVTERTTQLIGVEDTRTNKMMDTNARE
jgi:zinc ribbon protein